MNIYASNCKIARRSRCAVLLALCASISISAGGCYSWVPIQTHELPLLNNMHVASVGSTTSADGQVTTVNEVGVRSMHRLDGRTVRINGAPSVRVHTIAGTLDFRDPVVSSLQPGQSLTVVGANHSAVTIPLDQIELVEARNFSRGKTTALWVSLVVVGAIASGTLSWAVLVN